MKANKGPLGTAETTLVIQSEIENLSPLQVLIRDELFLSGTLTGLMATAVVKGEMTVEEAQQFEGATVRMLVAGAVALSQCSRA